MYGFGCNPYGVGDVHGFEHKREHYGGSTFVLIVVLFILLIIVGSCFV